MNNNSTMLQLCRLCLVKDNVNIPIFEGQGDISQIFQKISSCLPVKVTREDKLPQKICDGCSYKLDIVNDFRNTTVNAEKQLLTWLSDATSGSAAAAVAVTRQVETDVAQQIKPAETFVKQEAIDPSDVSKEEDDVKSYMFQDKFELPAESKTSENEDEPPPKRAKRTAAVKAAIALDNDSDEDDDDSGEPLTKVEDESDEGSDEDHSFVDIPSTSADDQPGPSGVNKDGGEAPIKQISKEDFIARPLTVVLTNLRLNKPLMFYGPSETILDERRKKFTCYVCMAKFATKDELDQHKVDHPVTSDVEDDCFEESFVPETKSDSSKLTTTSIDTRQVKTFEREKQTHVEVAKKMETKEEDKKDADAKVETSFKCDTCNVYFQTSDDAKQHTASVRCRFACRLCNRKFNTLYAFVVHVMQHQTNFIKSQQSTKSSYLCQICNKSFDDCFQLKRHEIQVHKKKSTSTFSSSTTSLQKDVEIKKIAEKPPIVTETEVSPLEPDTVSNISFTCELCYDIFAKSDELDKHMDFHKQLEKISEQVVLDDDDEFVEVIEDKSDIHEIKTTIRTVKRPPSQTDPTPTTSTGNRYPKIRSKSNKTNVVQPNKQLSDKIKEMLNPNAVKVSKTIFLSDPVLEDPVKKKTPKVTKSYPGPEIRQTGPLSYTVADQQPKVAIPRLPSKATTSYGHSVSSSTVSTTVSKNNGQPITPNVASNPQYAYVIIPQNNNLAGGTVVLPSSSTLTNTATSSETLSTIVTVTPDAHNGSSSVAQSSRKNPTPTTLRRKRYQKILPKSNKTKVNEALTPNAGKVSKTIFLPDPVLEDPLAPSTSGLNNLPSSGYSPSPDQTVSSSNVINFPSTSKPTQSSTSETTEIVVIDSDEDDEIGVTASDVKPFINNGINTVTATTSDVNQHSNNVTSSKKTTLDDSSDSETAGDLVIDEKTTDEFTKQNPECHEDNKNDDDAREEESYDTETHQEQKIPCIKGMISVKKLEDLVEPRVTSTNKNTGEAPKKKMKNIKFPVKCNGCSVIFKRRRGLRLHDKKKHQCSVCEFKCCKIVDMRQHYRSEHNKSFCCRCKMPFASKTELVQHCKMHTCKSCAYSFTDLSTHTCRKLRGLSSTKEKATNKDDSVNKDESSASITV